MFCEACGKEIKDTADFCSFCGTKVINAQAYGNNSLTVSNFQTSGNAQETFKKRNKKIIPIAILIICCICTIALLLVVNYKKEYALEGEWKSDDLTVLPEVIRGYVQSEGYPVEIANIVIELLALDDISEDLTLIFTEDNRILLTMNGVTVGSDFLSYQKMEENKILLQFEWKGTILGTSIPISIGYTGDYKIDKNKLTIDFFGYDVQMTRKTEEDKKASNAGY